MLPNRFNLSFCLSVQAAIEQAPTQQPAPPRERQSSVDSQPQAPVEEPAAKAQVQDDVFAAFEDSQTTSAAPPTNKVRMKEGEIGEKREGGRELEREKEGQG